MGDNCGLLKVTVIRGRNLAKRDLFSSDPYVKIRLGNQVVKTRVIKCNLNPEWNEDLTLQIPTPLQTLKLFVYDHDTFSSDDKMGDLEIDLHPLLTTARLQNSLKLFNEEDVNLRKVVATTYNSFVSDSSIKQKKGHVVQEIYARLKNVERGQIELDLTWIPPLKL